MTEVNTYNLRAVEKTLVLAALNDKPSITAAAEALGVTRHRVKRLIIKHWLADDDGRWFSRRRDETA